MRSWGLPAHVKAKGVEDFDLGSGGTAPEPRSRTELEGIQKQKAEHYVVNSVRQGVPPPAKRFDGHNT
jgi:hypothetical protein